MRKWQQMQLVAEGQTIKTTDLPFEEKPEAEETSHAQRKAALLQALEEHDWHKSKAAASLGIARSTLRRRMALYGIE